MVDVERICRRKNLLVNEITKAKADNEKLLQEVGDDELSNDNKSTLNARVKFIESKSKLVVDLFEKIVDAQDDDELAGTEYAKSCEFEIDINKHLEIVKGKMIKCVTSIHSDQKDSTNVRLPKIEIRKFNGDPTEWQRFYDSFVCAVHEKTTINDVEKMNYLFNLLEGEALSMVKGFQLSNANYALALKMLEERFGDKQLLISSLMNKLINLDHITSLCAIKELRGLYDNIEVQVRSLTSLGLNNENYGPMLIPIIMSKLPQEVKLVITRQFGSNPWDVSEVLKALRDELQAREKVNVTNKIEDDSELCSGTSLNVTGREIVCVYCKKPSHKSSECRVVSKPAARKSILITERRCLLCLKPGHLVRNCFSKGKCFKCKNKHHVSICFYEKAQKHRPEEGDSTNLLCDTNKKKYVLLQTAQATISNDQTGKSMGVRILFDSGSQMSYVTPAVRSKLGLSVISKQEMCVKTFGGGRNVKNFDTVSFSVKTTKPSPVSVKAHVSEISYPLGGQNLNLAKAKYQHLRDLALADESDGSLPLDIDVLIGSDYYWSFIDGKTIKRGFPGEPVAISSNLGYIVSGANPDDSYRATSVLNTHVLKAQVETPSDEMFKQFWEIENIGIQENDLSIKNSTVLEKFQSEIQFNEQSKRYVVKLPVEEKHELLADNFYLSKQRLKSLTKKFENNRKLLKEYDDIISEQLSSGVLEKASPDTVVGETHYLPHKPVVREDKETTKTRIVFDASAKTSGSVSLNECLSAGPSLTTKLYDVLAKFRSYNIGVLADIEKAFLQIELDQQHRNLVRLLWFKNIENIDYKNFENNELIELRFTRILFGVNSSPFLLAATLLHHMKLYESIDPEFVKKVIDDFHVDDLISGAKTEGEAFEFYCKTKERLQDASFNLRKFKSNSKNLESLVQEKFGKSENIGNEDTVKVLGIVWNKHYDVLEYDLKEIRSKFKATPTKRQALQAIASVFDPLGLINPIVVKMKVFFQKLCYLKLNWDEEITGDALVDWSEIIDELSVLDIIKFPRIYCVDSDDNPIVSTELHGFCDASEKAYGCCVYLRSTLKSREVRVNLITAKSRVCPMKKVTIPKLELLGCMLLSNVLKELISILRTVYEISHVYAWTDSSVSYAWIVNDKNKTVFIRNRVKKIRENLPSLDSWKLIPSKLNPADLVSRGISPHALTESNLWSKGPYFLNLPKSEWPDLKIGSSFGDVSVQTVTESVTTIVSNLSEVVNIYKFSDVMKLLRVTAYVTLFIKKLKRRAQKKEEEDATNNLVETNKRPLAEDYLLRAEDLVESKRAWLMEVQGQMVKSGRMEQLGKQIDVFVGEDGVYRCKMRMGNSPLPESAKFPVIVCKEHVFIDLLIIDAHKKVGHNGVSETLTELRTEYFIPKGRSHIRKLLHRCTICKKLEGKSYTYPQSPDIPTTRLTQFNAFSHIGIDYAGPVLVRNIFDESSELFKCWIALITCQSSRAIHLDLATNYSGTCCVNVLRRFVGRRGTPVVITSDNGTNFISKEVQTFASNSGIKWNFNLEAAPWMGGFSERLIKSVKRCLKKVLGKRKVTYEEMITILIEIERIINNRPLVYVNSDLTKEPLTPSHLICGRRLGVNDTPDVNDVIESNLTMQQTLDRFWKAWSADYLTELRDKQRKRNRVKNQLVPCVGDVVLVPEVNRKRQQWRAGRITDLIKGKDGLVRGAVVAVVNKDRIGVLRRPINKLYPFEMNNQPDVSIDNEETGEQPSLEFISDENTSVFGSVGKVRRPPGHNL